jgi:hypothetical protein
MIVMIRAHGGCGSWYWLLCIRQAAGRLRPLQSFSEEQTNGIACRYSIRNWHALRTASCCIFSFVAQVQVGWSDTPSLGRVNTATHVDKGIPSLHSNRRFHENLLSTDHAQFNIDSLSELGQVVGESRIMAMFYRTVASI